MKTSYTQSRLNHRALGAMVVITMLFSFSAAAQEEDWEPQTFVTGYVNTIAEFTNQEQHKAINKDIGIGLAEVGFLASYKPLSNLEIKSTLVWKHTTPDLQSFVVEAYGMYTFSEKFKVGAGKFLTPLSPVNTYFYAPLNPSVVLPMVISHHLLTPQSISGVQFAGQFGNDFQLNYNVTYGTYQTNGHIAGGMIGLMGNEDQAIVDPAPGNIDARFDLGGSARLAMKYKFMSLGLNYFQGTRATLAFVDVLSPRSTNFFTSQKWAAGVDFHLNFNDKLKLNAEYWEGGNATVDDPNNLNPNTGQQIENEVDYDGYYVELLYTVGKFTPYVRYEGLLDVNTSLFAGNPQSGVIPGALGNVGLPDQAWGQLIGGGPGQNAINSFGVGVAYRPFYELLLKADYRMLSTEIGGPQDAINVLSAGIERQLEDQDFNHFVFSAVFSF